jgi:hypothetical protein
MKTVQKTITIAAVALLASSPIAMAQTTVPDAAIANGRSVSDGDQNIGRYSKTPTGGFNSTRSIEEQRSSGDGSGPRGGNPNGN